MMYHDECQLPWWRLWQWCQSNLTVSFLVGCFAAVALLFSLTFKALRHWRTGYDDACAPKLALCHTTCWWKWVRQLRWTFQAGITGKKGCQIYVESLATLKTGLGGPLVCEVWGWRRFIQVHSVHVFFFSSSISGSADKSVNCMRLIIMCASVFKLGQNVLRCSAIVDEERLFLIFFFFFKIRFTHVHLYFYAF